MIAFLFLHTPLVFLIDPVWRDEAFSVIMAKQPILTLLIKTAQDSNPPIYYLILKMWIAFFGQSEIAIRSLSLIAYCATLYGIYLIFSSIYQWSTKKSFAWLAFVAINPLVLYYAMEARMYMLFACFATYAWYALLTRKMKLFVLLTFLGIMTHYFMFFILAGQMLYIWIGKNRKKHIIFPILGLILVAPWMIFVYFQHSFSHTDYWIPKVAWIDIVRLPAILYTGFERLYTYPETVVQHLSFFMIIFSLCLWVLLGIGLFKKYSRANGTIIRHIIFTWLIVPTLLILTVSLFIPVLLPRYVIAMSAGLLVIIPYIIDSFPPKIAVFCILILIAATAYYQTNQIIYRQKGDPHFTSALQEIHGLTKQNDVIFVLSELDYFTAQYYAQHTPVYIYGKTYNALPWFVGKALIPESAIAKSFPEFPSRAFIIAPDGTYQINLNSKLNPNSN